ncbi:MAG: peptidyl-prolyl cis-trans isomerase, partial [Deltaproteobacteria bacterium]|nr:peptidyl-prolyl cis-trans isomerase [Deltaproteobacteria bacterium]
YYETNKQDFRKPDRYNLNFIDVDSIMTADKVMRELKGGGDFEFIAKNYSQDVLKDDTSDMGWVYSTELSEEIVLSLEDLKKDSIVGPFQVGFGYKIYRLNDFEEGGYADVDEVSNLIDRKIGGKKYKEKLDKYIEIMRKRVDIEIDEDLYSSYFTL